MSRRRIFTPAAIWRRTSMAPHSPTSSARQAISPTIRSMRNSNSPMTSPTRSAARTHSASGPTTASLIPRTTLLRATGPYWGVTTTGRGLSNAILQNFATQGRYRIQEKIMVNAAAVRSNSGGPFDFEVSASNFTYLQSDQISPWSAAVPFGGYTQTGRDTVFTGTYWTLFDAKGIVRPPEGLLQGHDISFGVHGDQFHLNNPVWLTTNWTAGTDASTGAAITIAQGTTRTQALWFQDAFFITPDLKFTAGLRGEHWTGVERLQSAGGRQQFRDRADRLDTLMAADLPAQSLQHPLLAQRIARIQVRRRLARRRFDRHGEPLPDCARALQSRDRRR